MLKKIFAAILFLSLLFAGCSRIQEESAVITQTTLPDVSVADLNIDNYPRVDGSTSTRPLQQTIACYILDIYCDWQEMSLFFSETRNILPPLDSDDPEGTRLFLYNLAHSGTHGSYMNLIDGYADVILVAREPSEDEIREAKKNGVKMDYRPIAQDAFVFLANVENPIESIDISQIRDIYTGKITTWDQLGVDLEFEGDRMISPYRRNPNSGSQELMESLVMQGEEMIEAPDLVLPSMIGPFNMIGGDLLGFGYSVYYYAVYMLPTETVRLVHVEGVLPTTDTIADGSYPFVTRVYVVIREDTPQKSTAVQLRNWLLTPTGQTVVAQSGYVPFAAGQETPVP